MFSYIAFHQARHARPVAIVDANPVLFAQLFLEGVDALEITLLFLYHRRWVKGARLFDRDRGEQMVGSDGGILNLCVCSRVPRCSRFVNYYQYHLPNFSVSLSICAAIPALGVVPSIVVMAGAPAAAIGIGRPDLFLIPVGHALL